MRFILFPALFLCCCGCLGKTARAWAHLSRPAQPAAEAGEVLFVCLAYGVGVLSGLGLAWLGRRAKRRLRRPMAMAGRDLAEVREIVDSLDDLIAAMQRRAGVISLKDWRNRSAGK